MFQKVLKFANYALAVLVSKLMLFSFIYTKDYASTIRQGLELPPRISLLDSFSLN